MSDKRVADFFIRLIIAWLGSICLISLIATRIETRVNVVALAFAALIFTVFYCTIFFCTSNNKKILMIALSILIFMILITTVIWLDGIRQIIADYQNLTTASTASEFGMIEQGLNVPMNASKYAAIMILLLIMSGLITATVTYSHSMLLSLLVELPLFACLMFFNVIPSVISFALLIIFIFSVAALEKDHTNFGPAVIMIGISALVCIIVISVFPKNKFKRPDVLVSMNNYIMTHWGDAFLLNATGKIVATGGLSNGELGNIDAIEYNHEPLVTVSTIKSDHVQYFPEFYGQTYENNSWSIGPDDKSITETVMKLVDSNQSLRDAYGSNNYDHDFFHYEAKLKYNSSNRSTIKQIYQNNHLNYTFFKNMVDQQNSYKTTNYHSRNLMTLQDFSLYEKQYRNTVYNSYLQVPDDVKSVITDLLGPVDIQSVEQKEGYLKFVKNYLADQYKYSFSPGRVPQGEDFVTDFLLHNKKGYCTYFASAAVMIYRSAGIPARYVEGFVLPPSVEPIRQLKDQKAVRYEADGTQFDDQYKNYDYELDDSYAHAWVEVYMDGYGWIVQEVTPATSANVVLAQVEKANENSVTSGQNIQNRIDEQQSQASQSEPQQSEIKQKQTEPQTVQNETQAVQSGQDKENQQPDSRQTETGSDIEAGQEFDGQLDQSGQERRNKGMQMQLLHDKHLQTPGLPVAIIVIVLLIPILIIVIRYQISCIKRKHLFVCMNPNQDQLLQMYQELERLLNHTMYERAEYMDYEQYAQKLISWRDFFGENQFDQIIDVVVRLRFSEQATVTPEDIKLIRKRVPRIRKKIYSQLKWYQKFLFKFIYLV